MRATSPIPTASDWRSISLMPQRMAFCWQVACEFIAASRKLAGQGFTPSDAWNRLSDYLDIFPLVISTENTLQQARDPHLEQRLSYWGAMVVSACLTAGVSRLYTEDLPGTRIPLLEIVNPFVSE